MPKEQPAGAEPTIATQNVAAASKATKSHQQRSRRIKRAARITPASTSKDRNPMNAKLVAARARVKPAATAPKLVREGRAAKTVKEAAAPAESDRPVASENNSNQAVRQ